jgi:hypothetical protein
MLKTGYLLLIASIGLTVNVAGAMDQELSKKRKIDQVETTDALPEVLPVCPPTPRKKARGEQRRPARDPLSTLTREDVETASAEPITQWPLVHNNQFAGNAEEGKILSMLVALGNVDRVRAFLTTYPHLVHQKNMQGNTELHKAVRNSLGWYAALLCDRGAHVRESNDAGETPLSIAERQFRALLPLLHKYLPKTLIAY